jgi:N6-L-threonylcarbamoyladenine synthase/protein kinase Bud32
MKNKGSLLSEGAEAKVFIVKAFGMEILVKSRLPKDYRIKEIDDSIRKRRTKIESRVMYRLNRAGVRAPRLFAAGVFSIYYEKLDGKLMKDSSLGSKMLKKCGMLLAEIHNAGISHGDFTPANIIISHGTPYVIDFGLSEVRNSSEEMGIDLLLMKRSVSSSMFKKFMEGYAETARNPKPVIDKLEEIEKRGRYQIRTLG